MYIIDRKLKNITWIKNNSIRDVKRICRRNGQKSLRARHTATEKQDLIESTTWTDLCKNTIPNITISDDLKNYHKEMFNLQNEIISKYEKIIFQE